MSKFIVRVNVRRASILVVLVIVLILMVAIL